MRKPSRITPGAGGEGLAQLVALAVVAAEADGVNLADPERDQVVEDRAGRARLAADLDDVVDRSSRFRSRSHSCDGSICR